jgi:hypothetical protein
MTPNSAAQHRAMPRRQLNSQSLKAHNQTAASHRLVEMRTSNDRPDLGNTIPWWLAPEAPRLVASALDPAETIFCSGRGRWMEC